MDEKGVLNSCLVVSEEKIESLCPMYFGVSCAFFALRLLSRPDMNNERWSEICVKMLQGSAQLLGLLVWRVQRDGANGGKYELLHKLEMAEREIEELKKQRREDAKANEKVVGIFAAQEQCWFNERKKLRHQIGALLNELRVAEKKENETVSELNEKLKEMELLVQSKDRVIEEEEHKRKELEEKLKNAETLAEELRETAKREGQEHSSELWKHKTAFIELVSNQRQLEAEIGRALRRVETTKQELDAVYQQKEESVLMIQKLSVDILKMRKDMEQKDNILSAMLRKSKLDTTEKEVLLKEVKLSRAKRKQAELETEMLRSVSESRHQRHSLGSMLAKQANLKSEIVSGARGVHSNATGSSHIGKTRSYPNDLDFVYQHSELGNPEMYSPLSDHYSPEANEELAISANGKRLESWVHSESEKYATVIERRHHREIDAFAEQMRIKDEKLEVFRWRLLSMELESKRLQSRIEGLNHDMSTLKHKNTKLEALLSEREEELSTLKGQFESRLKLINCQKSTLHSSPNDPALFQDEFWSKEKIRKSKPGEKEQETKTILVEMSPEEDTEKENDASSFNASKDVTLLGQSPEKEFVPSQCPIRERCAGPVAVDIAKKLTSPSPNWSKTKNSPPQRMDLQALGVSFKIKRLKQQLLMLERLTGKQESVENVENNANRLFGITGLLSLISLLNKQVGRYQSLQRKTDELCKRMHENDVDVSSQISNAPRSKGESKRLEHFLEETFQLQRYIVSAGQKLMEMQSKIASGFVEVAEELENSSSYDMKRFADSVRTLFHEVQRGLEVRIARIIGDLEGTLACEGMIHLRR